MGAGGVGVVSEGVNVLSTAWGAGEGGTGEAGGDAGGEGDVSLT